MKKDKKDKNRYKTKLNGKKRHFGVKESFFNDINDFAMVNAECAAYEAIPVYRMSRKAT